MKNIDFELLIEACEKYGIAQEKGNVKEVNKQSAIIQNIKEDVRKYSQDELLLMKSLLSHENDYVRLVVASMLLKEDKKNAESVLEELSMKRKLIGFEAKMTLSEWKKGNIEFEIR